MKNLDKGLTLPKWVLLNHSKLPQVPPNFPNCLPKPIWIKKASLGVRSLWNRAKAKDKGKFSPLNGQPFSTSAIGVRH